MKKFLKVISVSAICAAIAVTAACSKAGKSDTIDSTSAGASISSALSEKTTVSLDDAIQKAVSDAGISRSNAIFDAVKLESENGVFYYEIDFSCGGKEFEYKIDADTAAIISKDIDSNGNGAHHSNGAQNGEGAHHANAVSTSRKQNSTSANNGFIGIDKAKSIALADAKADLNKVTMKSAKLDCDNNKTPHYDIEFVFDGYEYDYEINAETGTVLDKDKELQSAVKPTAASKTTASTNYISKDKAAQIALEHSGVKAENAAGLRVELDTKDIIAHYEVEFVTAEYEFEYKINAKTGAIISSEKEPAKIYGSTDANTGTSGYISAEEAKSSAFAHAGVDAKSTVKLKVKLDSSKNRPHYDVEFETSGYEYEYEIDAVSGKILKSEKEKA